MGSVTGAEYLGSVTRLSVTINQDVTLFADVQNTDDHHVCEQGEKVLVAWSTEDCLLLLEAAEQQDGEPELRSEVKASRAMQE